MGKLKCLQCNTVLHSKYRHDFQSCDCPNQAFIDGGNDYYRCGAMDFSLIEHLPDDYNEEEEDEEISS